MIKPFELNDATFAKCLLQENEVLADKIMVALDCRREDANKAMLEVLRFLYLVANNQGDLLTPSQRVDLAWHEFILCTKTYREVCNTQFGRFIDHHPGGSTAVNRRRYHNTLLRYERTFGFADPDYWGTNGSESDCGLCEAP